MYSLLRALLGGNSLSVYRISPMISFVWDLAGSYPLARQNKECEAMKMTLMNLQGRLPDNGPPCYAQKLIVVKFLRFYMLKHQVSKLRSNDWIQAPGRYREVRGDDRKDLSWYGLLTPWWCRVMIKTHMNDTSIEFTSIKVWAYRPLLSNLLKNKRYIQTTW